MPKLATGRGRLTLNVISMNILNNTVMRMKNPLTLIAIAGMLLSLTGCQEQLGGGARSIATKNLVYGIRAGEKLGFVIFTDITGASASAGSSWTGHIKPKEGLAVQYEGDSDGIVINGTEHKFADGRVFLVETKGGTLSVQQLNITIGDATYDAEIDRIVELEDVQEFLSK